MTFIISTLISIFWALVLAYYALGKGFDKGWDRGWERAMESMENRYCKNCGVRMSIGLGEIKDNQ